MRIAPSLLIAILLVAACTQRDSSDTGMRQAREGYRAGSQAKSTPGMPGYIYFVDEDVGDVMRVRPDGTGLLNLTENDNPARADEFPSPSFDGRHVVYARYDSSAGWRGEGNAELAVMEFDGNHKRGITDTPGIEERTPAFEPGDSTVIYSRRMGPQRTYELYRIGLDNARATQLTDLDQGITEDPVASPDCSRIAFQSRDATRLYVANADGSGVESISDRVMGQGKVVEKSPAWHPSGAVLAFSSSRTGRPEIFIAAPDGSGLFQLTTIGGARECSWSPDGTMVCFMVEGDGIWIINSDGTGLRQVTGNPRATFPRWGREPR